MGRICYILLISVLTIENVALYSYSQTIPMAENDLSELNTTRNAGETHVGEEKFDGIADQLQGMRSCLENMKRDYDSRFEEMQNKIAILEKENEALKKDKNRLGETMTTVAQVDTDVTKTSMPNSEHTFTSSQQSAGAIPTSPTTTEPVLSSTNTTSTNQPLISETGTWSPAQPLTLWSTGKNYMNISFDGLFAAGGSTSQDLEKLETGGHDPNQRGFTVQNLETVFEGAIDPYFKGQANIVFQIDKNGESFVEVEEAYLTTMSLPLNLQVKAGTFFTEFGRLNQVHPHAWDFADQPLVNGRFLGPDGMRNPGVRISWLAPTDNYTELFFTAQDSQGETAFSFRNEKGLFGREPVETRVRNMEDMLYTPRMVTSFDLTDQQTLVLGASAAFGPNSTGTDKNTLIYGLDTFWKWKSRYASGGFPFVTWQTEVMGRRFEAGENADTGLPDEVMHNWGAYSQISWGFKKRWVAGLRGDYVDGEKEATDPLGFERLRLSPNLTFYPSEFSKIRLQYNYDDIIGNDSTEHAVFLQFEFLLGSHGAHKF